MNFRLWEQGATSELSPSRILFLERFSAFIMQALQTLEKWLVAASELLWGYPLVVLLLGTHIYLTIRLGFIQRYMGTAIRLSFQRDRGARGDISPFGALTTALAATVGTGNIVGVSTAIAMGGPGAVFWMWMTGVLGIATKYAEAVLALRYRVTLPDGQQAGGPMYVLARGFKMPWLGALFAVFTAIAAFGIGNMVQSHSIAMTAENTFGIKPSHTGIFLTVITALVILGGIRWIARACEFLVPFMILFYLAGCIVLLVMHAERLPDTIQLILKSAFTGQAAVGGFLGAGVAQAIRMGVARGLFSNESGLGSAPILAAAARTRNPVRQGLVSASGTFWDTVVVCLMTGLVIVNSGTWTSGSKDAVLTRLAFGEIAGIGDKVLVVALFTFVFSTILGWAYYGEKAAEYLLGTRVRIPYRILWVLAVYGGTVVPASVWTIADLANGLMAIPNLVALLALTRVVVEETRTYLWSGRLEEWAEEDIPVQDREGGTEGTVDK